MSTVGEGTGVGAQASDLEIHTALASIMASPGFTATRRAHLLKYLIERTLAGEAKSLTEYGIALDVFGKPESFDPRTESTIRAEMSRLRKALTAYYEGPGATEPWRFDFPARGYVPVFITAPEPAVREPAPALPVRRWPRYAAISLVALAVFAATILQMGRLGWFQPLPRSVIVLPFANLTGDPANDYIADGITEDLTDVLAHIPSLRVVARTSAFQFKGRAADIRKIGRSVDADTVVEGSLQKNNGRLRITVQVNRAKDGFHVLSRRFEGEPQELATIEHDMALPVLAILRPGQTAPPGYHPDPTAYDLVLKARALRGLASRDAFNRITALLNEAIQRDPSYAAPYAALASAYVAAATTLVDQPLDYAALARAAAAKALELDPGSAPAYASEGYTDAMIFLEWKRGEGELRNAVELMPQNATIHNWLGLTELMQGKFAPALEELKTAERLDPLAPAAGSGVALGYFMARQYDAAIGQWSKLLLAHPDTPLLHIFLASGWEAKGDYSKAAEEYRKYIQTPGARVRLAHLLAVSGKRDEARKLIRELELTEEADDPISFAAVYGALGDNDLAFEWLEKAWKKRAVWILKVHPELAPLRSDKRFSEMLRRAGFSD